MVDIKTLDGLLIECKSWTIGAPAFVNFKNGTSGSFGQFLSYLQNGITNMSGLEYWFDSKKESSETALKEEFKSMMYQSNTLTTQGEAVFNAIWANEGLRGNLFPETIGLIANDLSIIKPSILVKFQTNISNTNHGFYGFIKVK